MPGPVEADAIEGSNLCTPHGLSANSNPQGSIVMKAAFAESQVAIINESKYPTLKYNPTVTLATVIIIFDDTRLPPLMIVGPQSLAYFDSDSDDSAGDPMDRNENSTLTLSTTNLLAP